MPVRVAGRGWCVIDKTSDKTLVELCTVDAFEHCVVAPLFWNNFSEMTRWISEDVIDSSPTPSVVGNRVEFRTGFMFHKPKRKKKCLTSENNVSE